MLIRREHRLFSTCESLIKTNSTSTNSKRKTFLSVVTRSKSKDKKSQTSIQLDSSASMEQSYDRNIQTDMNSTQQNMIYLKQNSQITRRGMFQNKTVRCNKFTNLKFDSEFDMISEDRQYGGSYTLWNTNSPINNLTKFL